MKETTDSFMEEHRDEIENIIYAAFRLSYKNYEEWEKLFLLPFACVAMISEKSIFVAADVLSASPGVTEATKSLVDAMSLPIDEYDGLKRYFDDSFLADGTPWLCAEDLVKNLISSGKAEADSVAVRWLRGSVS